MSMVGDHALRSGNGLLSRLVHDHANITQPISILPGPLCNNADRTISIQTTKHNRVESLLSSITKLLKRKVSVGAKIVLLRGVGVGVDKMFRRIFTVSKEEQLLRASRCCLSTTAGPIPGRLFISTFKLAFCSDTAIANVFSPSGESISFHYKVVIPLTKIKINRAIQSENMKKPKQKYVQVVTTDEFEFWFMGLIHYQKTFKCLQQIIVSQSFKNENVPFLAM